MADLIPPRGGWPKMDRDAGVGTEVPVPARQPETGCSASNVWLIPLVFALIALATRTAGRRPAPGLQRRRARPELS
jgi:hypothetical protein